MLLGYVGIVRGFTAIVTMVTNLESISNAINSYPINQSSMIVKLFMVISCQPMLQSIDVNWSWHRFASIPLIEHLTVVLCCLIHLWHYSFGLYIGKQGAPLTNSPSHVFYMGVSYSH